jgi:hypothetical protein
MQTKMMGGKINRRAFVQSAGLLGLTAGLVSPDGLHAAVSEASEAAGSLSLKRELKLDDQWDVIVVGGGPSGCAAATAAAREGAKTLLIEGTGVLGGMGTSGMVPAWTPYSDGNRLIYQGIAEKVWRESKKGVPHVPENQSHWVDINAEHLKVVYDNLVKRHGVKVLFFTRLAGVDMKDDRTVNAIIVVNKAGLTACKAKVYVDCTGDGDLAVWAGAKYAVGDKAGDIQKPTFCFMVANVNTKGFKRTEENPEIHPGNPKSPIYKILETKDYPLIIDNHVCAQLVGEGTVQFNMGHLEGVNPLDPDSLSEAMARGRQQVAQELAALKRFLPQVYEKAFIVNSCNLLGVRETRRIEGDYTFTVEDWLARREFDDGIGRNINYIDIHKGSVMNDFKYPHYKSGESHGIPYRILTPKGKDNLLVAGRPVSTDEIAFGSLRIMGACLVTGEAAGLAAALAAKQSARNVHQIDVAELRKRLKEEGQLL